MVRVTSRQRSRIHKAIPQQVRDLTRRLQDAGHAAYLVGGAVRNLVLDRPPDDYDIATSATPDEVTRLFRRVIPTGVDHGTVTVLWRSGSYEVTTFRTETGYSDGRHPDTVEFVGSIHADLSRRDFTINGMAIDPVSGEFLDPHCGAEDLRRGVIRAIGVPQERFAEDSLRLLRAVRFATQLEFSIEAATYDALCAAASGLGRVSVERIRDEFDKILASERPSLGIRLLRESRLLPAVMPELEAGIGVEQRGDHAFDVFEHSLVTCDAAPRESRVLRLAALLHDIGKPATLATDEAGNRTFFRHDEVSADLARSALERLRYPNAIVDAVTHLVRHHMFHYTPEWTDAAIRRFLARVGPENVESLFSLRAADSFAQQGKPTENRALKQFGSRIADMQRESLALSRADLAVNGSDLAEAGIPRGPHMGVVLEHLLETVLDDPQQNTRDQLIRIARSFYESRLAEEKTEG
jgi:putative nucleotidyltransferase with HDIG domain